MRDRTRFPRAWLLAAAAFAAASTACATGRAQIQFPAAPKLSAANLFVQQCGTCHSLNPADPPRQGPLLAGVYGRKPGSVPGFHYSPGYAKANFVWDAEHLDTYLTDPKSVIADSIMLYRQKNPDIRKAIIAFLKDQK